MTGLAMACLLEDGGGRPGNGPAPLIVAAGLVMALLLGMSADGLHMSHLQGLCGGRPGDGLPPLLVEASLVMSRLLKNDDGQPSNGPLLLMGAANDDVPPRRWWSPAG